MSTANTLHRYTLGLLPPSIRPAWRSPGSPPPHTCSHSLVLALRRCLHHGVCWHRVFYLFAPSSGGCKLPKSRHSIVSGTSSALMHIWWMNNLNSYFPTIPLFTRTLPILIAASALALTAQKSLLFNVNLEQKTPIPPADGPSSGYNKCQQVLHVYFFTLRCRNEFQLHH